jgi:hypothetical protein
MSGLQLSLCIFLGSLYVTGVIRNAFELGKSVGRNQVEMPDLASKIGFAGVVLLWPITIPLAYILRWTKCI